MSRETIKAPLRFRASGRDRLQLSAGVAHETFVEMINESDLEQILFTVESRARNALGNGQRVGFFSSILTSLLISLAVRFAIWLVHRWWENRNRAPYPAMPIVEV